MSDPATIAFYEANAPRYVLGFAQAPSRHLDGFLDRLPSGARILELGCGGGRDSAHMVKRGFGVDPTDGTPAMVAKARERFGIPARTMLFEELDVDREYDAVWAHACLIHVSRVDLPAILAAIRRALRPAGLHYASFKLGDGEGRDPLGRLHNFPDDGWLREQYEAAGFAVLDATIYRGEGADGVVRDWCAMTVRKPG